MLVGAQARVDGVMHVIRDRERLIKQIKANDCYDTYQNRTPRPVDGLAADAVVITHPREADVFILEPGYSQSTQSMELSVEVDPPVAEVKWLVDGELVESAPWPYGGSWKLDRGSHTVQAVAGGRRSEPVRFEVR